MEPVESEEVMTVAMYGRRSCHEEKRTVHCTRRGPALPGGDYDFSGHFTLHMEKSRTGVELNGHDEKARFRLFTRKGLISYGAFVQN